MSADQRTCADNGVDLVEFGLTNLTSGYFSLRNSIPDGKCAHGVIVRDTVVFDGINKDYPFRTGFALARGAAIQSTTRLVEQIIASPGVAGNDAAIMEFMGSSGSIGFIIDDTGSMGAEIDGVKSLIRQIIAESEANRAAGTVVPTNYLMIRYGDPDVGSPVVTKDPNALLASVNALYPHGGGDCPELAQTALLRAVQAGEVRSTFYFFSDASSKDRSLAGRVQAAANDKKSRINYTVTGSCSPIDPAYIQVAQATGGQVFYISPYEVGQIFPLIEPTITGDQEPILLVQDVHDGTVKSYMVPVDPSVKALTFSITSENLGSVKVYRPSGVQVSASDTDVTEVAFSRGRIVSVTEPGAGEWRLEITGAGSLSASVLGNSGIGLYDFAFVEELAVRGNTGVFSITGQPVVSTDPQLAQAYLLGDVATAEFELRNLAGEVIKTIPLKPGSEDPLQRVPYDSHFGAFVLPDETFRVYVTGEDASGAYFQRAYPAAFLTRSVEVIPAEPLVTAAAGDTYETVLTIINHGPADYFDVAVSSTLGSVGSVTPSRPYIESGAAAEVVVRGAFPEDAEIDTDGILAVEVKGSGGNADNTAVVHLQVEGSKVQEVSIDILPGNDQNPLNLGAGGVTPVAILGASRSARHDYDFDVETIDFTTLRLSGASARASGKSGRTGTVKDINRDGVPDLLVHFEIGELEVDASTRELTLEGETTDGKAFGGVDGVELVPERGR